MAVNRSRLGVVLQAALTDMPAQQQRSAQFAAWEAELEAYHASVREAKRAAKRERMEAQRRAAQEELAAAAAAPLSPRNAATRARFGSTAGRSSWREGRAMGAPGEWLVGSEDLDQAEAEAREAAAAGGAAGDRGWGGEGEGPAASVSEMSGGSMGGLEAEPADTVLVDPLAARWVGERGRKGERCGWSISACGLGWRAGWAEVWRWVEGMVCVSDSIGNWLQGSHDILPMRPRYKLPVMIRLASVLLLHAVLSAGTTMTHCVLCVATAAASRRTRSCFASAATWRCTRCAG